MLFLLQNPFLGCKIESATTDHWPIIICLFTIIRYYKNSVSSASGWNPEVFSWCHREARRLNLKDKDLWYLIFDEMTIQVHILRPFMCFNYASEP